MAVTVYAQRRVIGTNRYDYDLKGLSTDPKPSQIYGIDIVENSLFLEMDTGDFYYLKSQGSSSTTRETLIEEQSFIGIKGSSNFYESYLDGNIEISVEPIKVNFDGTVYTVEKHEDSSESACFYGAPYHYPEGFDWSEYPFYIESYKDDTETWITYADVPDSNEHTIEVYTESTVTTPTVWEKVGGGGSEPSGDGYEINNPTLTVTVENTALLEEPLLRSFIDNDGYLSFEPFTPSNGDTYTTLVFAYDGDDDYIYFADATSSSNKVNCTFDGSTSLVTITDPSKDASITLSWRMG